MIPLNRNLLKLKRSGIRAYSALAAETPGCISLTLGEPEFDTPAPITAAGKAALDGGKMRLTDERDVSPTSELSRNTFPKECEFGSIRTSIVASATTGHPPIHTVEVG